MTDRTLKTFVEDELKFEPSLDETKIGVSVNSGVVTLSGSVATYLEKVAAEKAAQRIKGVRGVAVDLDVRPFGDKGTRDDEVAKRALTTLDWDSMVPKGAVTVTVDDGALTLGGEVEWAYQRAAAEKAVQRLYGVRSVVNQIRLHPRVAPTDVKRRIVEALHRQARIDADHVTVAVEGGRVKLSGQVHSLSDRAAVERAAWAAPGVLAVEDRVSVSV